MPVEMELYKKCALPAPISIEFEFRQGIRQNRAAIEWQTREWHNPLKKWYSGGAIHGIRTNIEEKEHPLWPV